MARASLRLPQNAPGEFFVDETCIDCATCRNVAPSVFGYSEEARMTVVKKQPAGAAETRRAAMALVACPTSSIGSEHKSLVREASRAFPEPVGGDVYYCGYAAEASFGASSWLIVRPEGNVLVDSPRAARPLIDRIAALGGVRTMFLTHRDDVADHDTFARRFGAERIMHAADVGPATRAIERKLEGSLPTLLAPDLLAIPVPGHTRGSVALLHRGEVLFSGDHLWGVEGGVEGASRLGASRGVCWYSWAEQTRSMERLVGHDFSSVLPGHGSPFHAPSASAMRQELTRLIEQMKAS
jgi:glyoxylase-like metal-dependent hydrolase (beta-lactamase superfamily II)/ferredoxin